VAAALPEIAAAADCAVVVEPDNPAMCFGRALVDMESRADTQPAHEAIQSIATKDLSGMDVVADLRFYFSLCRRAAKSLSCIAPRKASFPFRGIEALRSLFGDLAARARNDATAAEVAFTAAHVEWKDCARAAR